MGMSSGYAWVVALKDQIDPVSIEHGHPRIPQRRAFAPGMRAVHRVVEHHELPRSRGARETIVQPIGLNPGLFRARNRRRAVEHRKEGVADLDAVGEFRCDPLGTIFGEREEGAIEHWSTIEVLMIAHGRQDRQAVEDTRRAQEEMVPVRPFVAPVDEVPGNQQGGGVGSFLMGRR